MSPIEHTHIIDHTMNVQQQVIYSKEMMREMGQDFVNQEEIVIGFKCRPVQ